MELRRHFAVDDEQQRHVGHIRGRSVHAPVLHLPFSMGALSSPFAHLAHVLYCFNMFRLELIPSRSSVQANEIKMLYRTYAELVAASGAGSTDS